VIKRIILNYKVVALCHLSEKLKVFVLGSGCAGDWKKMATPDDINQDAD